MIMSFRSLLNEWLIKGVEDECVDNNVSPAAIGYCFGGVAVLKQTCWIESLGRRIFSRTITNWRG